MCVYSVAGPAKAGQLIKRSIVRRMNPISKEELSPVTLFIVLRRFDP